MAERKSDSILPTLDDLFSIQESQILPSEKAFAYKMRLGAMKRQGQRTDLIYLLIEKGACHSSALFYSVPLNPFVTVLSIPDRTFHNNKLSIYNIAARR